MPHQTQIRQNPLERRREYMKIRDASERKTIYPPAVLFAEFVISFIVPQSIIELWVVIMMGSGVGLILSVITGYRMDVKRLRSEYQDVVTSEARKQFRSEIKNAQKSSSVAVVFMTCMVGTVLISDQLGMRMSEWMMLLLTGSTVAAGAVGLASSFFKMKRATRVYLGLDLPSLA